jgi:hypothetical protein
MDRRLIVLAQAKINHELFHDLRIVDGPQTVLPDEVRSLCAIHLATEYSALNLRSQHALQMPPVSFVFSCELRTIFRGNVRVSVFHDVTAPFHRVDKRIPCGHGVEVNVLERQVIEFRNDSITPVRGIESPDPGDEVIVRQSLPGSYVFGGAAIAFDHGLVVLAAMSSKSASGDSATSKESLADVEGMGTRIRTTRPCTRLEVVVALGTGVLVRLAAPVAHFHDHGPRSEGRLELRENIRVAMKQTTRGRIANVDRLENVFVALAWRREGLDGAGTSILFHRLIFLCASLVINHGMSCRSQRLNRSRESSEVDLARTIDDRVERLNKVLG